MKKAYLIKNYMTEMPHTIGADIEVDKAIKMMEKFKCHHLPVLEGHHLVGVISERDLTGLPEGSKMKIEDVMSPEPLVVDPDANIKDVASDMLKHKFGSAIVRAKGGHPWGIFTITDALRVLVDVLS